MNAGSRKKDLLKRGYDAEATRSTDMIRKLEPFSGPDSHLARISRHDFKIAAEEFDSLGS